MEASGRSMHASPLERMSIGTRLFSPETQSVEQGRLERERACKGHAAAG